jgi:hypothetical protein
MLEYGEISEDVWEQLAPIKEPDPWQPLMLDLSEGMIISLPYADGKDRRAKRLSIARRAALMGFKTEARYTDMYLAVRRADHMPPPRPAEDKPRQRRRRKE